METEKDKSLDLTKPRERLPNEADFTADKVDFKDENGKSIFAVTTRYKWILALSILILIVTSILIYAKYNGALGAEYWQMATWGLCGLLSFYAIIKKSLAATLFNLVLFFGLSLIPAWGLVYQFVRPILELLTGSTLPESPNF